MSPAFIAEIEKHFPGARITFDKFHVMKLMNVALDEVRRMEQLGGKDLKKTRYIWLKNPENLSKKQEETLSALTGPKSNLKSARAWRIKLALQEVFAQGSDLAQAMPSRSGTGGPVTAVWNQSPNSLKQSRDTGMAS